MNINLNITKYINKKTYVIKSSIIELYLKNIDSENTPFSKTFQHNPSSVILNIDLISATDDTVIIQKEKQ